MTMTVETRIVTLPTPSPAAAVAIIPVSFSTILDVPNAPELLRAYAEECLVPDAQPQRAIYAAMEQIGALRCFAAYMTGQSADFDSPLLVGFVSVLVATMPHSGHRLATVESLFVDPACRDTGAGNLLLLAAEQYARDAECSKIVCTARVGSPFETVLSIVPGTI